MRLRVFESVCRLRALGPAASELGVRQPAITFHLSRLEAELGLTLMRRDGRRFELTEAGGVLLDYARRMIALEQELQRSLGEYASAVRGALHFAASHVPGCYLLPALIARFRVRRPAVTISVNVLPAPGARELLATRSVDAAVIAETIEESRHPLPGIQRIVLADDDLALIVPPGHNLAKKTKLSPPDLADAPFIHHESCSTTRRTLDSWAHREGVRLDAAIELTSVEAIRRSVARGLGISVVSGLVVDDGHDRDVVVRPLPGSVARRSLSFLWREDRPLSPLFAAFLEIVKSADTADRTAAGMETDSLRYS
ncbi:MAG: LysR substrate-binding domain-containing protein [Spirochaetota bacterium]